MQNNNQRQSQTANPEEFYGLDHVSFRVYKKECGEFALDIYRDPTTEDLHLRLNRKWINPLKKKIIFAPIIKGILKVNAFNDDGDREDLVFDFKENKFKPCCLSVGSSIT